MNRKKIIVSGSMANGGLDPMEMYSGPSVINSTGGYTNAYISGLQLDAASGELYFAQGSRDAITGNNAANQTGIFKMSEPGTGVTQAVSLPSTALDAPHNFAVGFNDNPACFTDNSGRGS